MLRLLLNWVLSAVLLLVVSRLVPGFEVTGFKAALIAALVVGLINATLGFVLKVLTFPLTLVTLGVFLLVINALMLMLASHFVDGFAVTGFWPAFLGAILLSLLHLLVKWIMPKRDTGD
ncbi:MAG TPA: phage holin family protein [Candidatus Nanoarchaeia archaeon]|nr:phage holin family protein [Candidatus Nanoarchaeia archaeon]